MTPNPDPMEAFEEEIDRLEEIDWTLDGMEDWRKFRAALSIAAAKLRTEAVRSELEAVANNTHTREAEQRYVALRLEQLGGKP